MHLLLQANYAVRTDCLALTGTASDRKPEVPVLKGHARRIDCCRTGVPIPGSMTDCVFSGPEGADPAREIGEGGDRHPLGPPQCPSRLLEKCCRAFGRPQHRHGVDFGKVAPALKEIDLEGGSTFAAPQSREQRTAIVPGGAGIERRCPIVEARELPGREVGVADAGAESRRPHLVRVGRELLDSPADPKRSPSSRALARAHRRHGRVQGSACHRLS